MQFCLSHKRDLAILEMAEASVLTLIPPEKRNSLLSSSYGIGQLIAEGVEKGVPKIFIGIGGSAISDGRMGMLAALGIRFF